MNWKTCGGTKVSKSKKKKLSKSWPKRKKVVKKLSKKKKSCQKVVKKFSKSCQKVEKSSQKVIKKVVKKLSKVVKKLSKSCQKSCQKVVKKLSKCCQKVVKKAVKKLSKSCQKVVKKLSLFSIIQCFLCVSIHDIGGFRRLTFNDVGREGGEGGRGGEGGWGQKVLSWPSADSFAVGRRQKESFRGRLRIRLRISVRFGAHPTSCTIQIGAYFKFLNEIGMLLPLTLELKKL
jgi:hypothetical protein